MESEVGESYGSMGVLGEGEADLGRRDNLDHIHLRINNKK